jgi:ribosomal-protein-alanine N-acetyltransferase
MNYYFLKTSRLGFRQWSIADLPLAMALWGDPEVTRFIGGPFSPDKIQKG